jgi:hypothetical protein
MYEYDALIVHWQNNTVTIMAKSQKAREYFKLQGWENLHEITDEWPDDFMPPLLIEGLVIAMKQEHSNEMSYVEAVPNVKN